MTLILTSPYLKTMEYSAQDIRQFNKRDKRISWLSIFSSLNQNHQLPIASSPEELAKIAYQLNDELNERYPQEEPQPFPNKHEWKGPAGSKNCPVCNLPMVLQTDKVNAKAPDWKCSDKNCKFQLDRTTGKYVESKFITGVWN